MKSGLAAGNYSSEKIANSGGGASIANVSCSGNVSQAALLVASPASFLGFDYALGNGPSASQSFLLSGAGLIPAAGNIAVTGTDIFEVSTNNSTFSGSLTLPYTGGTLTLTTVYTWMKPSLEAGTYSGEKISVSGGSATPLQIVCNGNVIDYTNISSNSYTEGKVYVNHEYLYISVPEMEGKKAEIGIYNAMGQQNKLMRMNMQGLVRMESPSVPGIYIVRINAGTEFFSAKIIVGRK